MNRIRIVLIGGGHAHIEVVRQFQSLFPARTAEGASVEMVLVNPEPGAVYSGMIPGVVGGHYRPEDCLINLPALCDGYGVGWYQGRLQDLNIPEKMVVMADGHRLQFDYLSLDIGSVPATGSIQEAYHAVAVKPAHGFLQRWEQYLQHIEVSRPQSVVVVGGGVAGVELVLAMEHRIRTMIGAAANGWRWHLVSGGEILIGHNVLVRHRARRALQLAGVNCMTGVKVERVHHRSLELSDGVQLDSDFTLLCTSAAPSQSLSASGLPLSEHGYVRVDDRLQVRAIPEVFAVGDIADFPQPLVKAGVYAVRQGPVLAHNLAKAIRGEPLQAYTPQKKFLKLISLGGKKAMASRGWFFCSGAWVWRWKNSIDSRFMEKYQR